MSTDEWVNKQNVVHTYVLICLGCQNKMPRTGWLQQRTFISSQFWGLEVEDEGVNRAGFSWGFCGFQEAAHLWYPHSVYSLCPCLPSVPSSSLRTPVPSDQSSTLMISFNFITSFKDLYPSTVTWNLELQHKNFGGDTMQFITTHKEISRSLKKGGNPGTCYPMGEPWGHYRLTCYTVDLYGLILEPATSPTPRTLTPPNQIPSYHMPLHTPLLSPGTFFLHFSHQRESHPLFQACPKCSLPKCSHLLPRESSFPLSSVLQFFVQHTTLQLCFQPTPSTNCKLPKAEGSSSCHLSLAQSPCRVDTQ